MADPAWLKPFSPSFRRALRPALSLEGRRLACFDADGTLWSEDIGEAFLRWLIAADRLPRYRGRTDLYEEYEHRVAQDRVAGYAFAVQAMADLPEAEVQAYARWFAAAWPNTRPLMRGLVLGLQEAGFEVWIVSATARWMVQAAAPLVGLPADRVIAIEVEVHDGVLTDRPVEPVVCMPGKVAAIRKYLGAEAVLAFGDSRGDQEMLESARIPLVIGRKDQRGAAMVKLAAERGWGCHLF